MMHFRIYFIVLLILMTILVISCKPDRNSGQVNTVQKDDKPTFSTASVDPNLITPYNRDSIKPDMVRIGLLVSKHPEGKDISLSAWHGAELAVREINHNAGIHGKKIALIVRTCDGPWGMGSTQAVNMAYKDSVTAIVASADGRNSHLIEQVVAKTHTPVVSAWATEPTLTEAFVPWFFRLVPNDRQQAEVLIREIYKNDNRENVALISFGDYDSRQASKAFCRLVEKQHLPIPDTLDYMLTGQDTRILSKNLLGSNVSSVIFMGHPRETCRIIREIAALNPEMNFYGNSWLASYDSLLFSHEGKTQLTIISPSFLDNSQGEEFINDYRMAYGDNPDAAAVYAYDGVCLLYDAIIKAGTSHETLRDLIHLIHYNGISGEIQFDEHGNLVTGVRLRKCFPGQ